MDALSQDLRVALRRMQRAPTLTTAIVLTIGLGLGAAAAIFTASDAALVEPLPYAEPDIVSNVPRLATACQELRRPRGLRSVQPHRRRGRRGAHGARRASDGRLLPAPWSPDIG